MEMDIDMEIDGVFAGFFIRSYGGLKWL